MQYKYNLDIPDFMEASVAAERWGISDSRIRQKINDFPEGQKRKFGKQWVVTQEGMEVVFGKLTQDNPRLS
jgi:hypothetical protein